MARIAIPYTEEYKQKCFQAWFTAGRPIRPIQILKVVPEDDNHRKPTKQLLAIWRKEMNWDVEGDKLFTLAVEKANTGLINKKAQMLEHQADVGFRMAEKAMTYLMDEGFDSAASAVAAVKAGVQIERESRGISELMMKVSKMSDEDVQKEILRLTSKVDNGDIIDVEETEVEDDTESTDHEFDLPEN